MRSFTLSDSAAKELWTALNDSTAEPHLSPLPPPPPPAPMQNISDLIVHPMQYTPPAGGNPPPSANQSPGPDRTWFATASSGAGYFVDRSAIEKPMAADPKTTYNPYDGPGLLAAISEAGGEQWYRNKVYAALFAQLGVDKGKVYLENSTQADPTWNGALGKLVAGLPVADVWASVQKGQNGLYSDPLFTLEQLDAAKRVVDSFR